MKVILILSLVFFLFTAPAFSELSVADLEQIRAIVKEEQTASETKMKELFNAKFEALDTKFEALDTKFDIKFKALETKFDTKFKALETRLDIKFESVDKRLGFMGALIIALITTLIVVVGVPLSIISFQLKRQREEQQAEQQRQREEQQVQRDQQEQIEALRREIEILKDRRIIEP